MAEDTLQDTPNVGGRPEITEQEKQDILSKLEPYLKSGLSVRKALLEAGVANATFYRLMDRDEGFREQINRFKNFVAVLLNNAIVRQLQGIIKKQNDNVALTKEEQGFLQWFATNSNLTREEFGERKDIGIYDPEAELHRLMEVIEDHSKGDKTTPEEKNDS